MHADARPTVLVATCSVPGQHGLLRRLVPDQHGRMIPPQKTVAASAVCTGAGMPDVVARGATKARRQHLSHTLNDCMGVDTCGKRKVRLILVASLRWATM